MAVKEKVITAIIAIIFASMGIVFVYWLYSKDIRTYDDCIKKRFPAKKINDLEWQCNVPFTAKKFFFLEEPP